MSHPLEELFKDDNLSEEQKKTLFDILNSKEAGLYPIIHDDSCGAFFVFPEQVRKDILHEALKDDNHAFIIMFEIIFRSMIFCILKCAKAEAIESVSLGLINDIHRMKSVVRPSVDKSNLN